MALKRQQDMLATFSMASMTDVIFLLLVFFLVTSSFVFPTAVDVNLPEGSQQTSVQPSARVFIDADGALYVSSPDTSPVAVSDANLPAILTATTEAAPDKAIALYVDTDVPYGRVVEVLNMAAELKIKMILATKAAPASAKPNQ